MNRFVAIDQQVLARWKGEIDGNDAVIVAHVLRLQRSEHPKVVSQRKGNLAWVDYRWLLAENPLLNFGDRQLRSRLRRLVTLGVLEKVVTPLNDGTRRAYYRVGTEYEHWLEYWNAHASEDAERVYEVARQKTSGEARKNTAGEARKKTSGNLMVIPNGKTEGEGGIPW